MLVTTNRNVDADDDDGAEYGVILITVRVDGRIVTEYRVRKSINDDRSMTDYNDHRYDVLSSATTIAAVIIIISIVITIDDDAARN